MRPENLARLVDYDNSDSNTEIQSDSDCDRISLTSDDDDEPTSSRININPSNQEKKDQKQEAEKQDDKQKADEFMRECKINNCISYEDSLYSIEDHKIYNNNTIRSNALFYYYIKGVTPVKQDTKGAIVERVNYKYVRDTESVYFIPEGRANTEVVDITRSSQEKMVPCKKGCGKMTMNGTHRGPCKGTPVCGGANKRSKGNTSNKKKSNTNNRKRKRPTPPPSPSNDDGEEKVGSQGADSTMEDHILGLFRHFLGSKKKEQRISILYDLMKTC